jgi:cytoskeleton protein RodZ
MSPSAEEAGAPGPALAAARLARGLSPAQVAEQMRLTPDLVLAMEEGRYQVLGPAVFARGHLRRYAALLGVPAEAVLADFDGSSVRAAESNLIPPTSVHTPVRGPRARPPASAVLLVVAAVLLAAAAGGWWLWRSRSAVEAAAGVEAAPPATTVPPAAGEPMPADATETGQTDTVQPAAPAGAEPAAEGAVNPTAPATSGSLIIEFTGPCWLEVYDAAGRRLAFELAGPGDSRVFGGPAPWRLVLGNASFARVSLDGSLVQIPPSLRVREAALVSVTGSGEVGRADASQDS